MTTTEENKQEEPLNIAKILKNAPRGAKLYSPVYGEVTFIEIDLSVVYPIVVRATNGSEVLFTSDGRYLADYVDAECVLFPSKENHDWSTFKGESQFPMNYDECCKLLNDTSTQSCYICGYREGDLCELQILLIYRDAWWKADGDWEPNWTDSDTDKFVIENYNGCINVDKYTNTNFILAFRTEEIANKFLEAFDDLIEACKELI